ncbi:unnamed protein product [Caenorhabditis nigoni]
MALYKVADGILETHVTWDDIEEELKKTFNTKATFGAKKTARNISDLKGFTSKIALIEADWQNVEQGKVLPKNCAVKICSQLPYMAFSKVLKYTDENGFEDQKLKSLEKNLREAHNREIDAYKLLEKFNHTDVPFTKVSRVFLIVFPRQGRLAYFHGCYFVIWLTIPVIFGVLWGMTIGYFVGPDLEKTEYLRESILTSYNLSMDDVTYVGSVYWRKKGDGGEEIVMDSMIAMGVFMTMMTTSFTVVCYYGYKSYKRITSLIYEGESTYTRNLQKQLYKALVVQAIIPIVLMYAPVGSYLILPFFGVNIAPFSKLVTFVYAAYPAVDPLPLMFIIDNYRNAISDFFFCCTSNKNRVAATEEEISRGQTTI